MMGSELMAGVAGVPIVLIRATVLLFGAVGVGWMLRGKAAQIRHLVWTATFVLLLGLPAAAFWLPSLEIPLLPAAGVGPAPVAPMETPVAPLETPVAAALRSAPGAALESAVNPQAGSLVDDMPGALAVAAYRPTLGGILVLLWSLGVLGGMISLGVGTFRFRALVGRSRPVRDPRILTEAARIRESLGLRREVALLESVDAATPMAGGIRRPVIVLPREASEWPLDRLSVVLTHEHIHVRRHDALRHVLGCLALSVYWFHPLSWVASRLSVASREQACDQEVVALGTRPSDYARHLLELADRMGPAPAMVSLPMVQRSQLERRVMSILAPNQPTRSAMVTALSFIAFCAFGVTAAVAIPVALQAPPSTPGVAPAPVTPQVLPTPVKPVAPLAAVVPSLASLQEGPTCRAEGLSGSFRGSISRTSDRTETSGWHGDDRVIQRYLDGLRLCLRTHGEVVMNDDGDEVRAVGRGGWAVLESEGDALRRLVVTEGDAGLEHLWTVDGTQRPFDDAARAWRHEMFTVLSAYWEAARLRGEQSSLRGQISSMRGHVSSLKGQISSHRGHVSSLRGQISSSRGHVSSLKGEISSQRGHVSSWRGQISSLRGRISSLRSAERATSDPETLASLARELEELQAWIQEVEREIEEYDLESRTADVEREIEAYGLESRTGELEARIADYDLDGKIRVLEQEIEDYDLDGKVEAKEREIEELDADRRAEAIEAGVAENLANLRRLIGR